MVTPAPDNPSLLRHTATRDEVRSVELQTKIPTRAQLKASTSFFTFKTMLRHYAKQALTHGLSIMWAAV